jgi:hypothetical protein
MQEEVWIFYPNIAYTMSLYFWTFKTARFGLIAFFVLGYAKWKHQPEQNENLSKSNCKLNCS